MKFKVRGIQEIGQEWIVEADDVREAIALADGTDPTSEGWIVDNKITDVNPIDPDEDDDEVKQEVIMGIKQ